MTAFVWVYLASAVLFWPLISWVLVSAANEGFIKDVNPSWKKVLLAAVLPVVNSMGVVCALFYIALDLMFIRAKR